MLDEHAAEPELEVPAPSCLSVGESHEASGVGDDPPPPGDKPSQMDKRCHVVQETTLSLLMKPAR